MTQDQSVFVNDVVKSIYVNLSFFISGSVFNADFCPALTCPGKTSQLPVLRRWSGQTLIAAWLPFAPLLTLCTARLQGTAATRLWGLIPGVLPNAEGHICCHCEPTQPGAQVLCADMPWCCW